MATYNYRCQFCDHGFVRESSFLKHKCKPMIRDEQFRTATGQFALGCYQKWMKLYKRPVTNPDVFIKSKFFRVFYEFAQFAQTVKLPDINIFIRLMRDRDISPMLWTTDQVYNIYLEVIDRKTDPIKLAHITIKTLFDVADEHEVDVSEIFNVLTPHDVIQLFKQRRVSPWIMLLSQKFSKFFSDQTSIEERIILESIIRPHFWREQFKKDKDTVETMKRFVVELGL